MKNYAMKLKKSEGFISIETIMVSAVVIAIGIVGYNVLFVDRLATLVGDVSPEGQVVFSDLTPFNSPM